MHDPEDPANDPGSAFTIWVNRKPEGRGQLTRTGAVVKIGRRVLKTVTVSDYGDQATGELRKRELRFRTHERRQDGQPGWNFDESDPKSMWYCENDEVEKVLAFLHSDVATTGRFRVMDTDSPEAALLELLVENATDLQALAQALIQQGSAAEIVSLLAGSTAGLAAAESAVVSSRRQLVARLHDLIRSKGATETEIQRLIGSAHWLFGGRYVGVADRRNLMPLDQHDIPLLAADGTLHIIELTSIFRDLGR